MKTICNICHTAQRPRMHLSLEMGGGGRLSYFSEPNCILQNLASVCARRKGRGLNLFTDLFRSIRNLTLYGFPSPTSQPPCTPSPTHPELSTPFTYTCHPDTSLMSKTSRQICLYRSQLNAFFIFLSFLHSHFIILLGKTI